MSVPMIVSTPAARKPRLIGAIALLSLSVARTEKTPTIEASTPMARAPSGKSAPAAHNAGLCGKDRGEGGNPEDDRRDQRDFVRLEQVGGHTAQSPHVVADVVGDSSRGCADRLRDCGFDLADEVGADVGPPW